MRSESLKSIFTYMMKSKMGRSILVDFQIGQISEKDLRIAHRQMVFYKTVLNQ